MFANESSHEAEWQDVAPRVDGALEQLPEDLRVPLILRYLEARTQTDIAAELGVNHSTVSRRIKKGLDELRKALKKTGTVVSATLLGALLTDNAVAVAPPTLIAALGKMAMAGIGETATGGAAVTVGSAAASTTATSTALGTTAAKVAAIALAGAIGATGWSIYREMAELPNTASPARQEVPTVRESLPTKSTHNATRKELVVAAETGEPTEPLAQTAASELLDGYEGAQARIRTFRAEGVDTVEIVTPGG